MSFWKKTQQERDAAFLAAVGEHEFYKAEKLVGKGANPLVMDAEGNTAFHKLTGAEFYDDQNDVDRFVCYLLRQGLDIHARNGHGQTCLHMVMNNKHLSDLVGMGLFSFGKCFWRCTAPEIVDILVNRGARLADGDAAGRTLLHLAAAKDSHSIVNACVKADPSLLEVQDGEGKYPHDCAVAGAIQHYNLQKQLLSSLDQYRSGKAAGNCAAAPAAGDNWVLLRPDQVAHVSVEKAIGYKLTEIFNFSARSYTVITRNLETETEMTVIKGFDDFADKGAFITACRELVRLGGQADEDSVHRRPLDKKTGPFSGDA